MRSAIGGHVRTQHAPRFVPAPTIGQTVATGASAGGATTTTGINTQTTTNIILFVEGQNNNTPPTITDNKGNSWTGTQVGSTFNLGAFPAFIWVFAKFGIAGGSGHTFTATKTNGFCSVFAVELVGSCALDTNAQAFTADSATPYTSANVSPVLPVRLVGYTGVDTGGTINVTWGNSFTELNEISNGASFWTGSTAHRLVSPGTYQSSVTITGTIFNPVGCILLAVKGK